VTEPSKPAQSDPGAEQEARKQAAARETEAKEAARLLNDPGPGSAEFASAEPPPTSRAKWKTYRAKQALYGPLGLVRAGELFVASPDSGYAKSVYVELDVVKALEAAEQG